MKKRHSKSGFSFVEIAIALLIVSVFVVAIVQGIKITRQTKLKAAQNITINSSVSSMNGIILWLDASDSDTIATGTTITSSYGNPANGEFVAYWEDRNPKIVNHRSLSAATDSNQPEYIKNGIGGLPAISFDGLAEDKADYLFTMPGIIPSRQTAFSIAIVFSDQNVKSSSQHFLISQGGSCIGGDFSITTEDHIRYIGCGAGATADLDSFLMTKNKNPYILIVNVDKDKTKDQISIYLNDELFKGSQNISNPLESNVFSIGRSAQGIGPFSGLISEIIVFDRYLEISEITAIQAYLSKKYDIKF